ncbi:MAG: hypothetical protein P8L84_02050 [Methylococcaceae bacterium]|nr:hypothetical protein [Methylococcaceae bacterium]
MHNPSVSPQQKDLFIAWLIWSSLLLALMTITLIGHFNGDQYRLNPPNNSLVLLRTVFYGLAIITFPVTNIIRHIMVRLNQTMPGDKTAKARYQLTTLISMLAADSIGFYGITLYLWGDPINTLYIFSLLSALAFFLYRPKFHEYHSIHEALISRSNKTND